MAGPRWSYLTRFRRTANPPAQRRASDQSDEEEQQGSDLFACDKCNSLWLLSTRNTPEPVRTVEKVAGNVCSNCEDADVLRLLIVKRKVIRAGDLGLVAEPVKEVLQHPPDAAVKFTSDVFRDGPDYAVAKTIADHVTDYARRGAEQIAPAESCRNLDAIADGLGKAQKAVADGFAWCVTAITGLPEFPAKVIGTVVAKLIMPVDLGTIAKGVRLVGAAMCAADDHLGDCQCARKLIATEAAEIIRTDLTGVETPKPTTPHVSSSPDRNPEVPMAEPDPSPLPAQGSPVTFDPPSHPNRRDVLDTDELPPHTIEPIDDVDDIDDVDGFRL